MPTSISPVATAQPSRRLSTASDRTMANRLSSVRPSTDKATPLPTADLEKGAARADVDEGESPAAAKTVEPGGKRDLHLVVLEGKDDPLNPQNWSPSKKFFHTAMYGISTLVVTMASSAYSAGITRIREEFHVGTTVATLGTSLFVAGFAAGPQIWGPFSELYGRKPPLLIGYFAFSIFAIPVAAAQNIQTVLLCRFVGGLFGSAPLAVIAGTLTDFWAPEQQATAIGLFALATFGGPALGPIVGATLAETGPYGWRWIEWFLLCLGMLVFTCILIFADESYVPVLLQRRGAALRHETQDWAYHAHLDMVRVDFHELIVKYLFRPIRMLILEPILMALTVYLAFIYGLLYLLFSAVPIVFGIHRRMEPVPAALPFLAVFGGVTAAVATIVSFSPRYAKKMAANGGKPVPEERLLPMSIGAVVFPIGLFWFAWSASPDQLSSPWSAIFALTFIGYGILIIFLQGLNYIIDVYLFVANSAIAGNTFLRSLVGCGFPLFAAPFYNNLGVQWATSTLAFIALAMMPIPFLFYKYGPVLRRLSKYAPTL